MTELELHDYDDMLIGNKKRITTFYNQEPGGGNELIALQIIRYAIEKVLAWTPEEAVKKFDFYMIKKMQLEKIITYIHYPIEMQEEEPTYILSRLYPNLIKISPKQLIEYQYEIVLFQHKQFPRDYFIGTEGFYRYCVCTRYLFYNYKKIKNLEEMYQFALSPEGRRFFSAHRLLSPAIQLDINMADVIYEITKQKPKAKLYHARFALELELEKKRKRERGLTDDMDSGDLYGEEDNT